MYHHLHISHLRYGKELKRFYSAAGVWNFGHGLIQIFIPIFLFTAGFNLDEVFFFSLIAQAVRLVNVPFAILASEKFGAKHVLSFSFIFPILFFFSLSFIDKSILFLYLASIFFGLKMAYLSIPYHLHLSKIAPDKKRGRILASAVIISALAMAAAPAIGGFTLGDFGILPTAALASVFFIAAAVILMTTKEETSYPNLKLKRLPFKKVYRDALASGFYNISSLLGGIAWFIFAFLILETYLKIGIIGGASLGVGVLSVYLLGKMEDKFDRKKVFVVVSFIFLIFAVVRVFLTSFSGIIIGNVLYALTGIAASISWTSIFHTNLDKSPKAEYLFWTEFVGALFSIFIMAGFLVVYHIMGLEATLVCGIIVSGVAMLFVNITKLKK